MYFSYLTLPAIYDVMSVGIVPHFIKKGSVNIYCDTFRTHIELCTLDLLSTLFLEDKAADPPRDHGSMTSSRSKIKVPNIRD